MLFIAKSSACVNWASLLPRVAERKIFPRTKGAQSSLEKVQAGHENKSDVIQKWLRLSQTGMLLRTLEISKIFRDVGYWDVERTSK